MASRQELQDTAMEWVLADAFSKSSAMLSILRFQRGDVWLRAKLGMQNGSFGGLIGSSSPL
jgi:hypothetical protein